MTKIIASLLFTTLLVQTSQAGSQTKEVTPSSTPRKNPWIAFALSLNIPGAGQFYNGEPKKATTMLAGMIGGLAIATHAQTDDGELNTQMGVGILVMAGCSLWSMIDAPLSAERINREQGVVKRWKGEKILLSVAPMIDLRQIGARLTLRIN